ncbi:histidine triad nucleotide-binding protein [Leptospira ognonensis]|uniref:Histidine triad nucleotide-binding protein n=1 Tax=Leptospira ognonensis TaxID=2484945 RepID=A0A4R9KB71_9LEPT|nr:histidine triad nucleotide-binding protein [Leptospira ognonensis]TGL63954.1 histidine triad nucleotide-binding protein [Leptospira ognonensis]
MSENCLFCKIANGSIPSKKVYEDDEIFVFHDITPVAPLHLLLIPKKHIKSLNELEVADGAILGNIFLKISSLAREFGMSEKGYRVVNNTGEFGGQSVHHIHFHLLGGRHLTWPPG